MRSKPCRIPNFIAVAFRKAAALTAVGLALTMMHFEMAYKTWNMSAVIKTEVLGQSKDF